MLIAFALAAATSVDPIVSTAWLQAHLSDPTVRVVYVGALAEYKKAHIPGARVIDHMETVQMDGGGHRMASTDTLIRVFTKAGVANDTHVVLYGDSPMATGWVNSALAAIGRGDQVSWLDGGIALWQSEKRPIETATPVPGTGPLTLRPTPDLFVDAAWVRARLNSPSTRILDVRSDQEWNAGHLPNATFIRWQELFADGTAMTFKSREEIKALLARAGVGPGQEVVTYCAIGMRASLMAWAARSVGIPARIYLGSWQDWSSDPKNPVVK